MRYLLSIRTVFPKPGGKVWYNDQRDVHRQIFEAEETVDYAFMGMDPDSADNRWLREAYEAQVPKELRRWRTMRRHGLRSSMTGDPMTAHSMRSSGS